MTISVFILKGKGKSVSILEMKMRPWEQEAQWWLSIKKVLLPSFLGKTPKYHLF
jgi:hypothetical protein